MTVRGVDYSGWQPVRGRAHELDQLQAGGPVEYIAFDTELINPDLGWAAYYAPVTGWYPPNKLTRITEADIDLGSSSDRVDGLYAGE